MNMRKKSDYSSYPHDSASSLLMRRTMIKIKMQSFRQFDVIFALDVGKGRVAMRRGRWRKPEKHRRLSIRLDDPQRIRRISQDLQIHLESESLLRKEEKHARMIFHIYSTTSKVILFLVFAPRKGGGDRCDMSIVCTRQKIFRS